MTTRQHLTPDDSSPPEHVAAPRSGSVAAPFQPTSDTDGRLVAALAIFAVTVATFLIVLVMISASNV